MLREQIIKEIESHLETYMSYVKQMYAHPEVGNEEFESMKMLAQGLREQGFQTQEGYIVPTGFIGIYKG